MQIEYNDINAILMIKKKTCYIIV